MSKLWLTYWKCPGPDEDTWGVTDEKDNFYWLHNLSKDPSVFLPHECDFTYKSDEEDSVISMLLESYPDDTIESHGYFESLDKLYEYVDMYSLIEPDHAMD